MPRSLQARAVGSPLVAVLGSAAAVAAVTGLIYPIKLFAPVLSLGALYLLAVLPVAVLWGLTYAVPVSIASMLAFNFFHLPPRHSFALSDSENWFALGVYLVTAVVASELATRARARAADAEQREGEAALLADLASELLRGTKLGDRLARIATRTAEVLGVSKVRIELGPQHAPHPDEAPHPLTAGERTVGYLYLPADEEPALPVRRRLLPALASLLAVATERDRLSREALEAETLRHSDTVKTAVIQAVSHDLRTPLATIEAALDGLESGVLQLSQEDRDALFETIRAEHTRLKRLVENLLDLSRIEAGAAPPTPELWTADELVAGALDELADDARVRVNLPDDLPPVRVDALQVQRVLVNLLDNALKFSPQDEDVHVRVTATRKELIIRVIDRGPGVPAEDAERIFEAFQRPSGTGDQRGAGLGLAIARGFAEANNARLWVESRPGQGASFALAVPIVELPVEART